MSSTGGINHFSASFRGNLGLELAKVGALPTTIFLAYYFKACTIDSHSNWKGVILITAVNTAIYSTHYVIQNLVSRYLEKAREKILEREKEILQKKREESPEWKREKNLREVQENYQLCESQIEQQQNRIKEANRSNEKKQKDSQNDFAQFMRNRDQEKQKLDEARQKRDDAISDLGKSLAAIPGSTFDLENIQNQLKAGIDSVQREITAAQSRVNEEIQRYKDNNTTFEEEIKKKKPELDRLKTALDTKQGEKIQVEKELEVESIRLDELEKEEGERSKSLQEARKGIQKIDLAVTKSALEEARRVYETELARFEAFEKEYYVSDVPQDPNGQALTVPNLEASNRVLTQAVDVLKKVISRRKNIELGFIKAIDKNVSNQNALNAKDKDSKIPELQKKLDENGDRLSKIEKDQEKLNNRTVVHPPNTIPITDFSSIMKADRDKEQSRINSETKKHQDQRNLLNGEMARARIFFASCVVVFGELSLYIADLKVLKETFDASGGIEEEISKRLKLKPFKMPTWEDYSVNDAEWKILGLLQSFKGGVILGLYNSHKLYKAAKEIEDQLDALKLDPQKAESVMSCLKKNKIFLEDEKQPLDAFYKALEKYHKEVIFDLSIKGSKEKYTTAENAYQLQENALFELRGKERAMEGRLAEIKRAKNHTTNEKARLDKDIKAKEKEVTEATTAKKNAEAAIINDNVQIKKNEDTIKELELRIGAPTDKSKDIEADLKDKKGSYNKALSQYAEVKATINAYLAQDTVHGEARRKWELADAEAKNSKVVTDDQLSAMKVERSKFLDNLKTLRKNEDDLKFAKSDRELARLSYLLELDEKCKVSSNFFGEKSSNLQSITLKKLEVNQAVANMLKAKIALAHLKQATAWNDYQQGKIKDIAIQFITLKCWIVNLQYKRHELYKEWRVSSEAAQNDIRKQMGILIDEEIQMNYEYYRLKIIHRHQTNQQDEKDYFEKCIKKALVAKLDLALSKVQLEQERRPVKERTSDPIQQLKGFLESCLKMSGFKKLKKTLDGYKYNKDDLEAKLMDFFSKNTDSANLSHLLSLGNHLDDMVTPAPSIPLLHSRIPVIREKLELIRQLCKKPNPDSHAQLSDFIEKRDEFKKLKYETKRRMEVAERKLIDETQIKLGDKIVTMLDYKTVSKIEYKDPSVKSLEKSTTPHLLTTILSRYIFYPPVGLLVAYQFDALKRYPFLKAYVSDSTAFNILAIMTVVHLVLQSTLPATLYKPKNDSKLAEFQQFPSAIFPV